MIEGRSAAREVERMQIVGIGSSLYARQLGLRTSLGPWHGGAIAVGAGPGGAEMLIIFPRSPSG